MLGWINSLVARFRFGDRLLFRYWDGAKWRAIDPVAAHRAIWNDADCELLKDAAAARNPLKADGTPFYLKSEVHDAEDRIRDLTRRVFGVKQWREDVRGLTLDETDELLHRFLAFCDDFKKKRNTLPTPSASTGSTAPPSSSGTADSSGNHAFPAGVAADSCSTVSESNAVAPSGP